MKVLQSRSDSNKAFLRLCVISLGSLCGIAGCYIYYTSSRRTRKTTTKLPPTYEGWIPFLGVSLSFFKDVNGYLQSKLRHHPGGPFRLHLLGRKWTFLYDRTDITEFFKSPEAQPLSFLQGYREIVSPMLPKHFEFKSRTQFFGQSLSSSMMEHYLAIMVDETQRQVSLLGSVGEVDLFQLGRKLTMTINLRCIFGPKILEEQRIKRYHKAFDDMDPEKGMVNVLSAFLTPSKKEEAWAVLSAVTRDIMGYYRGVVGAEATQGGDLDDSDPSLGPPECLFHFLMRKHVAKGVDMDEETAIADAFSFIFASYTNSFAAMAWTVWHTAMDKTLAGELLKDVQGMDMKQLSSLDSWSRGKDLVDEVMRFHTPGIFFRKVMDPEGYHLSTGHMVPCGELVAVSARHLLLSEDFYRDPGNFRPGRFSQSAGGAAGDERKAAGNYWVAWGAGKHPCLGMKFATFEVLVTLACLISVFDIRAVTTDVRVSPGQMGTIEKPLAPVILAYVKKKGASITNGVSS